MENDIKNNILFLCPPWYLCKFLSITRGGMDYIDKNSFDLEIDMSP